MANNLHNLRLSELNAALPYVSDAELHAFMSETATHMASHGEEPSESYYWQTANIELMARTARMAISPERVY